MAKVTLVATRDLISIIVPQGARKKRRVSEIQRVRNRKINQSLKCSSLLISKGYVSSKPKIKKTPNCTQLFFIWGFTKHLSFCHYFFCFSVFFWFVGNISLAFCILVLDTMYSALHWPWMREKLKIKHYITNCLPSTPEPDFLGDANLKNHRRPAY